MFGTEVIQVEAGYKVVNPWTLDVKTVRDDEGVFLGRSLYVTKRNYEALQGHFKKEGTR